MYDGVTALARRHCRLEAVILYCTVVACKYQLEVIAAYCIQLVFAWGVLDEDRKMCDVELMKVKGS